MVFVFSSTMKAQVYDCSSAYSEALDAYNQGLIDSSYSLLNTCIENKSRLKNTSKQTRIEVYRLNALSCVLLNRPEEAEKNINQLLALKPYYSESFIEEDIPEFRDIIENTIVQPGFSLGLYGFTDRGLIYQYPYSGFFSVWDVPWNQGAGTASLGLSLQYSLMKRISLGAGVNWLDRNFYSIGWNIFQESSLFDTYTIRYTEFPLYSKFMFRFEKTVKPYIKMGMIGRFVSNHFGFYPYSRLKSKYGKYHLVQEYGASSNVQAYFSRYYENIELDIGCGLIVKLKKSEFDFSVEHIPNVFHMGAIENLDISKIAVPTLANEDPWGGVPVSVENGEAMFVLANDIYLIEYKYRFRFSLAYRYYLNFKTF